MNDSHITDIPQIHDKIAAKSNEIGFTMPSDLYVGTLLKTLVSSKPNGRFLELGTGIGFSLSWMLNGMVCDSELITIDNDPKLSKIAKEYFGENDNVKIICGDGAEWIQNYSGKKFDLIFADAWPGKYSDLDEVLQLINVGGFYIIDDMIEQPNWPRGHEDHADALVKYLEKREDFNLTKMNWSTGILMAVRTK